MDVMVKFVVAILMGMIHSHQKAKTLGILSA